MAWVGHVSRIKLNRLPRLMLTAWVQNPRPVGAPLITWGRTLKKHLKKAGRPTKEKEWMWLAKDRNASFHFTSASSRHWWCCTDVLSISYHAGSRKILEKITAESPREQRKKWQGGGHRSEAQDRNSAATAPGMDQSTRRLDTPQVDMASNRLYMASCI